MFVEVVVNVPLRRAIPRALETAGAPDEGDDDGESADSQPPPEPPFQAFHYHLPRELEESVMPGHLVWVPFSGRTLQGIVVRRSETAPVRTRAVLRLARPEPILSPQQIQLAGWIAWEYVAPVAEAVKLLLPPGLLQSSPDKLGVQSKRSLQIELRADPAAIDAALASLARDVPEARVLVWLATQPEFASLVEDVRAACRLGSGKAVERLAERGVLVIDGDRVRLAGAPAQAGALAEELSGIAKYRRVVEALAGFGRPVWRDELYAQVECTLEMLRALEGAGIVVLSERVQFRDPMGRAAYARTQAPVLTGEQEAAWNTVRLLGFDRPRDGHGARFLLHGVTGSGKTEIYLRSIQETLNRGRQAIVLVPEIALAPQTVARFAGRFPGRVTVIHSALSQGERYDVWRALRNGEFDIVVGPRSALFAPLPRLGLIVIDEEHESSYKQSAEEWGSFTVFYDARVVARRLAELSGSVLILGSATPSLEAYAEAMQGGSTLIALPRRVVGHGEPGTGNGEQGTGNGAAGVLVSGYGAMPPVEVVDMRQELRAGNRRIFSRSLQRELDATLQAGEQAILFLNRRGTNTFVMCRDCGYVAQCPRCEVPLVHHERLPNLICHHCSRQYPHPTICPDCGGTRIRYFGSGTEQIEQKVQEVAPQARVLRWDADTTTAKGSHETILRRFADHEADVLVGTQMIAKGLDLPLVTLVGVVAADVGLHMPDFRATERTFQLLTQVAGRAGRSRRGGRVVIQTYTPEHYAIQAAAQHDYHAFYRREMAFRREHSYPPARRMARLIYWDKQPEKARAETVRLHGELGALIAAQHLQDETRVFGPAPAFFARARGFFRWQILLAADDPAALVRQLEIPYGWRVDIDPVSVL